MLNQVFVRRYSRIVLTVDAFVGSQALLTCLKQISLDKNSSNTDKKSAKNLLNSVLDDEFLFHLHMHHDLHECILGRFIRFSDKSSTRMLIAFFRFKIPGPVTKFLQHDYLSYFNLMDIIKDKKTILNHWTSESSSLMGPALMDYIETTKSGSFGCFKIDVGDRITFFNDCRSHVKRLLQELDKRFRPSIIHENLSLLFDVSHLIKNKKQSRFNRIWST